MNKKKTVYAVIAIMLVVVLIFTQHQSMHKNEAKKLRESSENKLYEACEKVLNNISLYLETHDTSLIVQSIGYLHEGYVATLQFSDLALNKGSKLLWLAEEMYELSFTMENYKAIRYVFAKIMDCHNRVIIDRSEAWFWGNLWSILQNARIGADFNIEDIEIM